MWAAGIFFVCLVLVVLLQKFSLGQNYFVVTVNNKVVGCVSSKTNVERQYTKAGGKWQKRVKAI